MRPPVDNNPESSSKKGDTVKITYRFLKDMLLSYVPIGTHIHFRALKRDWGQTHHRNNKVLLNRKYIDSLVSTWVHEKIHVIFPELPEAQVRNLEIKMMSLFRMKEKIKLFKEIANHVIE